MMQATRAAVPDDVPRLAKMVADHAVTGEVLPRSAQHIRESLADWRIVEDEAGELVACGSLWIYGPGLAELRSVVVDEKRRGEGIGQALVLGLVEEARRRAIPTLFTLTRVVPFFERCGFKISDKEYFPEKIWKDCHLCPLVDNCDETALILQLEAVADHETKNERKPA